MKIVYKELTRALLAIPATLLIAATTLVAQESGGALFKNINTEGPLVSLGDDGKLVYKPFTDKGDILPDWSYCGYKSNKEPIPQVPVVITLKPLPGEAAKVTNMAYPVGPDSHEQIQAALDAVAGREPDANGFRGAVVLTKGTYYVSKTLNVHASGVVLRGEGDGENGTILIFGAAGIGVRVGYQNSVNMNVQKVGEDEEAKDGDGEESQVKEQEPVTELESRIVDEYVPTGSKVVTVEDASKFKPGDFVQLLKTTNQDWIDALGMGSIKSKKKSRKGKPWTPKQYRLVHFRYIVEIDGNKITLEAPLPQSFAKQHGSGVVFQKNEILNSVTVNCGVESLCIVSNYDVTISSQADAPMPYFADEQNTLTAGVSLGNCIDGWVRDVTVKHSNKEAVVCDRLSHRVTVRDCKSLAPVGIIRGGKRYPFHGSDAALCLFFNCYAEEGRHDFAGGSRDCGPNAFVMCRAKNSYSVTGPHQRWGTGYLFDNITIEGSKKSGLEAINRGASGSGHGWAGANTIFWNCTAPSAHVQDPQTPEQNFVIGFLGGSVTGDGHIESPDKHVEPQSLFLHQLQDRLGLKSVLMFQKTDVETNSVKVEQ